MKKELFNELQKSMEQALAHSRGKITLRTKQVPVPKKVTALPPGKRDGASPRARRFASWTLRAGGRRFCTRFDGKRRLSLFSMFGNSPSLARALVQVPFELRHGREIKGIKDPNCGNEPPHAREHRFNSSKGHTPGQHAKSAADPQRLVNHICTVRRREIGIAG
jgi:hypothetical protein